MTGNEYIMYCRKSTDESSGMQVQSIPDQIKKCVEYAKNNGIKIAKKPSDFSDFENEIEIKKEDLESDMESRRIYQETRNLFIIKEQKSGKVPGIRPKRGKLIKYIRQGKIKGLLSYSPDRQARNLLEGGELINLVDEDLVELKYTNFHFEKNASGKMMLGIRFVFSKQYSDKLSEDIGRGNKTTVEKGKSLGKYKYGYFRDEETGWYMPHPTYFSLMQEAFQMKLYMRESDEKIAKWLNAHGFYRETKKAKKPVSAKRLFDVWKDEFYYGMLISGETMTDQREINPHYEPLITEAEHQILLERYTEKNKKFTLKKEKDEYFDITPVPQWLVKTEDGYSMSRYLGNISRFHQRLAKIKKDNKNLGDVVKSHQIRYRMSNKASIYRNLEITFDEIEHAIIKKLDSIQIDQDSYQEYVSHINEKIDDINLKNREKRSSINLQLNRVMGEKKEYMKKNMVVEKGTEERKIYEEEKGRFDTKIELLQRELDSTVVSERDKLLEFEIFIDILQKSSSYYKKAKYVQKAKIFEVLFLNIIVDKQKRLHLTVKPWLESLFEKKIPSGGDDGNWTHV